MRETTETAGRRVLRDRKHYQDRLPIAIGTGAPSSADEAFGILPQYLGANIANPAEPKGWSICRLRGQAKPTLARSIFGMACVRARDGRQDNRKPRLRSRVN